MAPAGITVFFITKRPAPVNKGKPYSPLLKSGTEYIIHGRQMIDRIDLFNT